MFSFLSWRGTDFPSTARDSNDTQWPGGWFIAVHTSGWGPLLRCLLPSTTSPLCRWLENKTGKKEILKCLPILARLRCYSHANMPFCGFLFVQLLDQGLRMFPYPPKTSEMDSEEQLTSPPVGVSVTLPDYVIFLETPHVACWDVAGRSLNRSKEPESVQTATKMSNTERVLLSREAVEARRDHRCHVRKERRQDLHQDGLLPAACAASGNLC